MLEAWELGKGVHERVHVAKRTLDLSLSLLVLVCLAPFLLVLAALVRIRLGSPVLFRQMRPGLEGQPFRLVKFRTMLDSTDGQGNLLADAARLTPFGRFLRSSSLDELPELWNVVRGDMSLVGPRPLLMQYLDRYTPEQARRHEARPGITGWAQVKFPYGASVEDALEKLQYEFFYLRHQGPVLDSRILARTLRSVFGRGGR